MPDIKLSPLQKQVLSFFGRNQFGRNFYWTGGTLLSYHYFHHRDSVDLDFFSDNLFTDDEYLLFINQLKRELEIKKIILTKQHNRRMYIAEKGKEKLKLELVFFPFLKIEKRKRLPELSLFADSLSDIMTNKILSAYQRNEPKDAFDLYFYLSKKPRYNLFQLVKLVEKKFGVAIEPALLLTKLNELAKQLDVLNPLLFNPEKNLAKKTETFFQNIFNSFAKKRIR